MENIFNIKPQRQLVEECLKMTLSDLGKKLLTVSKSGELTLTKTTGDKLKIRYTSDIDDPPLLFINFVLNGQSHHQQINLTSQDLLFGTRPFFLCGCGHRGNLLYLRRDTPKFACKECLNLTYELTRINRSALGGELKYRLNRLLKIDEAKSRMSRAHYHGVVTTKMKRIARMYGRWVFDPREAEQLKASLHSRARR